MPRWLTELHIDDWACIDERLRGWLGYRGKMMFCSCIYLPASISMPLCRVAWILACDGLPQMQCFLSPLKKGVGSLLTSTRPPLAIPLIPMLFPTHQGTGRGFIIHPADSSESKVDGIAENTRTIAARPFSQGYRSIGRDNIPCSCWAR